MLPQGWQDLVARLTSLEGTQRTDAICNEECDGEVDCSRSQAWDCISPWLGQQACDWHGERVLLVVRREADIDRPSAKSDVSSG